MSGQIKRGDAQPAAKRGRKVKQEPMEGVTRSRKVKKEPMEGVTRGRKVKQEPMEGVTRRQKVKEEPMDEKPVRGRSKKGSVKSVATAVIKKEKASIKSELLDDYGDVLDLKQRKLTDMLPVKKKRDRFNGMTEDEVLCRTLPDHLVPNLDIVIIGINPGLTAAYVGHHYAGPGNHFWKCLHLSGLTPEQMNAYDDFKLKEFGIGFTNIVERTSRGSADLTKKEIKEGAEILAEKIRKYKPKIAAFNGKGIYEVFCGHKNFFIGKQPEPFPDTDTVIYVMPSSSARFTQLPRAVDKVPFYVALKKLRDHLCGLLPHLDESEVTFPDLDLKVEPKKERLDLEVKVEADITTEGGKTTPKRRKRKTEKTEQMEERSLPDVQPNLGVTDCPSGLVKVKTEPEVSTNDISFPWNGLSATLRGIPGACSGNPNAYSGSPNTHSGNLNNAYSGNPHPFINSFSVKEEIPEDLSTYGRMPSSSSSNNPYSPGGNPFQLTTPSVYSGFPALTLPFVTGSSTAWPNGALPSIYSNPLMSLAASFSYAPHSSALARIQPSNSKDCVPGSFDKSSSQ